MNLPFSITGTVQAGNRIGRTFDMPTANISPAEDISSLSHGVYYSTIDIDGTEYPAITNLGIRPTVSNDGRVNAETFIYDYDGDLYGKTVTVNLLVFHRPEQKFPSLEELKKAVTDDFHSGRVFHRDLCRTVS